MATMTTTVCRLEVRKVVVVARRDARHEDLPGGAWRDDRSHLLRDLAVPAQVLRGDSVPDAAERLEVQKALVPMASCCAVVPNSRAVLPWEAAPDTAKLVAEYLAANF